MDEEGPRQRSNGAGVEEEGGGGGETPRRRIDEKKVENRLRKVGNVLEVVRPNLVKKEVARSGGLPRTAR